MGYSPIEVFKNELRNYRGYQKRRVDLEGLIEETYRRLSGFKGIDTSKIPTHSLPNKDEEYRLRDNVEKYKEELDLTNKKIDYIESKLNLMEEQLRNQTVMVYADRNKTETIAKKFYMAKSTLSYRIDKELERILKLKSPDSSEKIKSP